MAGPGRIVTPARNLPLPEERKDRLRCLVGDRQGLGGQLLLHLKRLQLG